MLLKKPKYPKVLEAYVAVRNQQGYADRLQTRDVIHNEIEENSFIKSHEAKGHKIRVKKLNGKEISKLSTPQILLYVIPEWGLWLLGLLIAGAGAFVQKYLLSECK